MSRRFSFSQFAPVIALTGVLFLCLTLATPPCNDDLNYRYVFEVSPELSPEQIYTNFITCQGKPVSSFSDIVTSVKNHYLYFNNARFANDIAFAVCSLPPWVADFLSTVFFVSLLLLVSRMSGRGQPSWRKMMATVVLCAVLLPWTSPMLTTDFLINYLWSATLNLLLLWVIANRFNQSGFWWLIPLAFVAGGMHELFTVTFGAAALVMLWQRKQLISLRAIIVLLVYFAAGALIFFSPSMSSRLSDVTAQSLSPIVLAWSVISLSGAIAAIIALSLSRRAVAQQLPWLAMIAANLAVCAAAGSFIGRFVWPANLAGVVIILNLLRGSSISRSRRATKALVVGYSAVSVFMILLTLSEWRETSLQKQLHADLLAAGDSPIAYSDAYDTDIHPFFLKEYVSGRCIIDNFAAQNRRTGRMKAVLPERLRDTPLDSLPVVDGSAKAIEAYPYIITPGAHEGLKLTFAPAESYSLKRIPFAGLITRFAHGRKIIAEDTTSVTVLHTEQIAPDLYFSFALPISPLYSGRRIIRIDTLDIK